jgi:hypothetical protein
MDTLFRCSMKNYLFCNNTYVSLINKPFKNTKIESNTNQNNIIQLAAVISN